jgi:chemotaxis family two-component system response regulator Rcp1
MSARILQVEDNEADARLTREALREGGDQVRLSTVADGEQAMAYLRRESGYEAVSTPDLVLLDLNLPRKGGLEVLEELRADPALAPIPVIVLTSSSAERDVNACYERGANAFVVKPQELDEFMDLMGLIRSFWLETARLPSAGPWPGS